MSVAAYRIRKRIKERLDMTTPTDEWMDGVKWGYRQALDIIDEELEKEAEQQFTRPITQDALQGP